MDAHISDTIELGSVRNIYHSPAIELRGLTKTYRPQASKPMHAVAHVTLSVPAGQIVGVLGPSAAGKTTLVKLITGKLRPTAGQVHVWGYDVTHERARALHQLGMALEAGRQGRRQISAWQHLLHYGHEMDIEGLKLHLRATQLLHELDLWERRDAPLHTYSNTMQRKLALVCALLADPPIVVFD
jgi:ABC-2 type transport system ATP-binding protein